MTYTAYIIIFSLANISWAIWNFYTLRKNNRVFETTMRMMNPKRNFQDEVGGHVHKQGSGVSGTYTVVGGGGGGSGSGGAGGSGQVSVKYKTPTPSQGKVIRS